MSLASLSSSAATGSQRSKSSSPARPRFNSRLTSDRLREAHSMRQPLFVMKSNIRRDRRSVFKETGLDDQPNSSPPTPSSSTSSPHQRPPSPIGDEKEFGNITVLPSKPSADSNRSQDDQEHVNPTERRQSQPQRRNTLPSRSWYSKLTSQKMRPRIRTTSGAPPGASGLQRFTMIALLIAVFIPAFSYRQGQGRVEVSGAHAGVVQKRAKSATDVCKRWAHQAAMLNGTLYIYGGQAQTDGDQEQNTWNNNFLSLDLTKDWDTKSPALAGFDLPDGPPEVAMGYLWHDYNTLFLYGGQFSSAPYVDPAPESLWAYDIGNSKWTEHKSPETSAGNASDPGGQPVHRAAEGSGISVPELGLSWYFGGHLDWATTPGWSTSIDRVYLKSLLEFTHPGYVNTGVTDLSSGTGAPEEGAFRNITKGGVQAGEFPERADGALVYVPGWGDLGVLIGLAGGTEDTFTHDLKTLDVYDIANSEWFHQETSGDIPGVRVNPCAVIASAPDASSFQIYMFGGQNLPFGQQTQYNDMYILTIPSFSWIKVDQSGNGPSKRAGHTCTMQDGQIVLVGGYTGDNSDCDSPGVYVFDATTLKWQDSFKAADHKSDYKPENMVMAGSYGYSVPDAVQDVIGGGEEGGATVSTPAVGQATGGPFATGRAPVFTITQAGATATVTQGGPTRTSTSDDNDDPPSNNHKDKVNPGLIVAGVIAGIAGTLAFYLGFCAWLYRRQVRAYKQHLSVANRYSAASAASLDPAAALFGRRGRAASRASDETFGWVGSDREPRWLSEPKWTSDDPSPGTATGSGSGSASAAKRSEDTRPGTSGSGGSAERLLEGQEPSFFNVVMGPRRALRVVNAVE